MRVLFISLLVLNDKISASLLDGVLIWAEKDPRGNAQAEPESTEQSHERARQRTAEDGAARKENHC